MGRKPKKDLSNTQIVNLVSLQQLIIVGIGFAIWHWSGRTNAGFVTFDWSQLGFGLLTAGGFIAIMQCGFFIAPNFMQQLMREQGQGFSFLKKPLNRWQIIALSIGAGIGEEALFRAGIQTLFSDYMAMPFAILAASLLFGLLHMQSRTIFLILWIIGCIFGTIYHFTGSLLAVVIGHILYDIWAIGKLQTELEKDGFFNNQPATTDPENIA